MFTASYVDPHNLQRHEPHGPRVRQWVPQDINWMHQTPQPPALWHGPHYYQPHQHGTPPPHPWHDPHQQQPHHQAFESQIHDQMAHDSGYESLPYTTPQKFDTAMPDSTEPQDFQPQFPYGSSHIHEQPTTHPHRYGRRFRAPSSGHDHDNSRFASHATTTPIAHPYPRLARPEGDETLSSLEAESRANELDEAVRLSVLMHERQQQERAAKAHEARVRERSHPSYHSRSFPVPDQPFHQPYHIMPIPTAHISEVLASEPLEIALIEDSAHFTRNEAEVIVQLLEAEANENPPPTPGAPLAGSSPLKAPRFSEADRAPKISMDFYNPGDALQFDPRFPILPTPIAQIREVPSPLPTPRHSVTLEDVLDEEAPQILYASHSPPRTSHTPVDDADEALARELQAWNWKQKDMPYDIVHSTKPGPSTGGTTFTPRKITPRQGTPPNGDAAMAKMLQEKDDVTDSVVQPETLDSSARETRHLARQPVGLTRTKNRDTNPKMSASLIPGPALPMPSRQRSCDFMDEARIAGHITQPMLSPTSRFTVNAGSRISDQSSPQSLGNARSRSDTYVEDLIKNSLEGTDQALEVLGASGELLNETFERFIELGPQLVHSLSGVQDALEMKTKTLQKLPNDEIWGLCHNNVLASLTENLMRYLKVVTKLTTARAEKLESFTRKLVQYVRKFNSIAKKLTASFEHEQRRHVDKCLSKERHEAYMLSKEELARRKRWDNEWRDAKQRREVMHLQLHQRHHKKVSLMEI